MAANFVLVEMCFSPPLALYNLDKLFFREINLMFDFLIMPFSLFHFLFLFFFSSLTVKCAIGSKFWFIVVMFFLFFFFFMFEKYDMW